MRSGFLPDRIVHLHPTRLCNLACTHCYSSSDPQSTGGLDPEVICNALSVLRAEGYASVSLSGGEPLVYRPLRAVVERSRELGFHVTMISNGLLATAPRHAPLLAQLDAMAISFDGLAASHNAIRGRADAFDRASSAVEHLAAEGMPVGAAISLTRDAIPELPDLADHLVGRGAQALQVRPVARAGRARSLADDVFYSPTDYARLYLVVLALQQELQDVRVHCDLAPAQGLWHERDAYSGLLGECDGLPSEERPLADLVNPLVITEAGALKPIAYDFAPRYDVASVDGLTAGDLRSYKRLGSPALQALVGGALVGLRDRDDLVDWFDHCARLSEVTAVAA